jgi:hypothetical protein
VRQYTTISSMRRRSASSRGVPRGIAPLARGHADDPLGQVLAEIAGPRIVHEAVESRPGEARDGFVVPLAIPREQVLGQERDVLPRLPQEWQRDGDDIQRPR